MSGKGVGQNTERQQASEGYSITKEHEIGSSLSHCLCAALPVMVGRVYMSKRGVAMCESRGGRVQSGHGKKSNENGALTRWRGQTPASRDTEKGKRVAGDATVRGRYRSQRFFGMVATTAMLRAETLKAQVLSTVRGIARLAQGDIELTPRASNHTSRCLARLTTCYSSNSRYTRRHDKRYSHLQAHRMS
jgi:hypothetical protein